MKPKLHFAVWLATGLSSLALLAAAQAPEAPSVIPPDGVSDIGSFQAVPFGGAGQLLLRPEDKLVMRKLEDRHIQELRALEDRYEREMRALRARQFAERDQALKGFARR